MNAIKLPVEASHFHDTLWTVRDSNGARIGSLDLDKQEAHQIALALNCHDALVEAVQWYGRFPSETINWHYEIDNDGGRIALAALAKVEDSKKTS